MCRAYYIAQAAPLMCAGVTCFSAIKKAGMQPGAVRTTPQ